MVTVLRELPHYLNFSYLSKIQASNMSADRKQDLAMLMQRDHSDVGDFRALLKIWALDPSSTKLSVEYARAYSADSIKRHNVILIGSQISNPWTNLLYDQLPFTIEYSTLLDRSYILNKHPQNGEPSSYDVVFRPEGIVGASCKNPHLSRADWPGRSFEAWRRGRQGCAGLFVAV